MAQFPDGPVEWPWCIQLVHGAHSSLRSHWCLVAFPGTRINAAPLGGQKWERVSNSERRKAHESQGMTIDGKPSTTTTVAAFTSPLRGWLSPGQPPSPPRLSLQTQGVQDEQKTKPHEHLNPLFPAGTSPGEKNSKECVEYVIQNERVEQERDAQEGCRWGTEEEDRKKEEG